MRATPRSGVSSVARLRGIQAGVSLALVLVVLAGCARTPPPLIPDPSSGSPSVSETPSAGTPSVSGTPSAGTPSAPSFVSAAMPWPSDGGSMLWPAIGSNGAAGEYGQPGAMLYGFVDKSGVRVQTPKYATFDYCLQDGRPTRMVATRDKTIDVIDLGGKVTRTIAVSAPLNELTYDYLWCRNNTSVALLSGGEWEEYNLSTGAKIQSTLGDTGCEPPTEEVADPPLPDGYPSYALGGWASNDQEPDATFINLETKATVKVPSYTNCWGLEGYLNCAGRLVPTVYDKSGRLTDFAEVEFVELGRCNDTRLPPSPYLWATSGRVEGYIDQNGAWHYQQPLDANIDE